MRLLVLTLAFFSSAVATAQNCTTSVFHVPVPWKTVKVARRFRREVPAGKSVRMAMKLSPSDTLIVYDSRANDDPETGLVIIRVGNVVLRRDVSHIQDPSINDPAEWFKGLGLMHAAHLCGNDLDIVYLLLQAGNSGGYVVAIVHSDDGYRMLRVAALDQGRIVVSISNPKRLELWTAYNPGGAACTGCPKPFDVMTMELQDNKFVVIVRKRTRRRYSSFQDDPLRVEP